MFKAVYDAMKMKETSLSSDTLFEISAPTPFKHNNLSDTESDLEVMGTISSRDQQRHR